MNESTEELKRDRNLLRHGSISLILDTYNDIFSSFDPRHFSERSLSVDFLDECRRAARGAPDDEFGLEIRILIPRERRNVHHEIEIKKRLDNHFQKHFHEKRTQIFSIRKSGALLFAIGILMIFIASLLYAFEGKAWFYNFLIVLLEPAGWFTMWNGLERLFFTSREEMPEYEFYKKMAKARISFISS